MSGYTETDSLLKSEEKTSSTDNYGSRLKSTDVDGVPSTRNDHLRNGLSSVGSAEGSSVVTCHDTTYTVEVKLKPCCGPTEEKTILKGINGIFKPGMNAILGPTGSGKSSLLDALAGRKEPKNVGGTILIDGMPPPENFKCMVGYVVQDDVVMGTLTVRENFEFSAKLRLPQSVSPEERSRRVDQVISELGLTHVANSKVGNEFIRGVSGGERKRCNIGMELIISPPVLFLDEPTTGLDASTANAVMLLLKRLSDRGRNIIFSIHQPRYSIYRLFDSIMLLSHGDVVYHGQSMGALDYFSSIGYKCEAFNNPPDFFLDVINGDSTAVAETSSHQTDTSQNADLTEVSIEGGNLSLKDKFQQSKWCKNVNDELSPIMDKFRQHQHNHSVAIRKINYKTSFATQLMAVSQRAVLNLLRAPHVTYMQFFIITLFAVIVGAVYFQLDASKDSGIQNRVGAFFFIIMNQVFGNMSAVELFIKERAIFMHENVSGFYRVSAYFLAKVFCDVIPMRFIPSLIFSSIGYWMIGLQNDLDKFVIFALVLFLTALSASAMSFFISSSVRIMAMANLFLALSYVFMMLFSGLLVNMGDLGDWISWIKYFSIFRFSLNALSINELKDKDFYNANHTEFARGNDYLRAQGIPFETEFDLWVNVMALGIITLVFMTLAYVKLRTLKKLR